MRIAIVGAGLAGLSCAHELERLGHRPDIYELRQRVGDRFPNVEIMSQFLHINPHQDIFTHIRHDLNLPLNPSQVVSRYILHGPTQEATVQGKLGYSTIRGHDERSLEWQLARHIHTPIQYGQNPDVSELQHRYDHVVVATGDPKWPKEYLRWTPHVILRVRGANVRGDFNPGELHFFQNPRYAGSGYGLIAPFDERTAAVGVCVPHVTMAEAEQLWETFRTEQHHRWEPAEHDFRLDRFETGAVPSPVLGNLLFIGNAGGFAESLGINGQCAAMTSGVAAAQQMVLGDRSLERFARRWRAYARQALRLRQTVDTWEAQEMDHFVTAVRLGLGTLAVHSPWSLLIPAGSLLGLSGRPGESPEAEA